MLFLNICPMWRSKQFEYRLLPQTAHTASSFTAGNSLMPMILMCQINLLNSLIYFLTRVPFHAVVIAKCTAEPVFSLMSFQCVLQTSSLLTDKLAAVCMW
jgi:hypothetical protein